MSAADKPINYAGPTGREKPDEHWNARIIRETAEQRGRVPIHPPADDRFTYRAGGTSGVTFAIDVSGTPVIHYPGGTATISDLGEFIASVLVLKAALADREAHR
jgi:hypothetical protein